ncbi:TMV resistance protein N isoform X2 [Medicago truncatula]|uniref:TMV resistance protein N isoform X2 n=1 Tax=Medicago truncatula TaxID=3880 RepID=UPI000D2F411A|nr:TMV resistance protein N isoform X2 [Medicago truncatula]
MAMMNEEVDGSSYKYDVFLSFRGEDTYCTFAGNLYHALRNKKIKTFFPHDQIQNDDEELQLSPSILKAIQESRISIVVLSKNYATSTRCLNELVIILQCMKMKNQLVWPIFYEVHSSDVKLQRCKYGSSSKAILKFRERFKDYPRRMWEWQQALSQVTSIAGWNYGIKFEYELIQKIVELTVQSLPRYDVFLSFCGEDTRYSFTGFLYHALRLEGFKIFMDDEGLEGGNQISQTLLKAIEKSRLSIVVLSENYGYSTWCLDELVKIMECKKTNNKLVWPLFYKIEQSDLSYKKSSYGKAMAAHEDRFGKESENVQKWRSALSEVALLKADHIKENDVFVGTNMNS